MRIAVVVAFVCAGVTLPTGCDLIIGHASCKSAADCPPNESACVEGLCQASCTTNADCLADQDCTTSGCVAKSGEGEGEGAAGEGEGEGVAGEGEGEGEGVAGEGEGEGAVINETAVDDSVVAASHTGNQSNERVACDPANGTCLVVWRDDRSDVEAAGDIGDIFGALTRVAADTVAIFPITLDAGEQSLPDVAFDGDGFVVVWDDQSDPLNEQIIGTTVDEGGFVGSEVMLAFDARTPSIAGNVQAGTAFDVRVAWQTSDGQLQVARLTSLAQPDVTDIVNVATSAPTRVAVAADNALTAVLWQDPNGNVFFSREFASQTESAITIVPTIGGDVERLSLTVGDLSPGPDSFVAAISRSSTSSVDTFTIVNGASIATTPNASTAGTDGALAGSDLDGVLALRDGSNTPALGPPGQAVLATTGTMTGDVGVACVQQSCLLAGDNDQDGFLVAATVAQSGGTEKPFGRGAQRQELVSMAQLASGRIGVVWAERTDNTSAVMRGRTFDVDLSNPSAVQDLGAIAIDSETVIGTDGFRFVAAAVADGAQAVHVVELDKDTAANVATHDVSSVSGGRPVHPAVVPINSGAHGAVVAFSDVTNHVHVFAGDITSGLGTAEPAITPAAVDDIDGAPALALVGSDAFLVWSEQNHALQAFDVTSSNSVSSLGGNGASGERPVLVGRSADALLAVTDPSGANPIRLFKVSAAGISGAPIGNALPTSSRVALALDPANGTDAVVAAFAPVAALDPTPVALTIESAHIAADGTFTTSNPVTLPTPVHSLAVTPAFVAYDRFDRDPALLANRAFLSPTP